MVKHYGTIVSSTEVDINKINCIDAIKENVMG